MQEKNITIEAHTACGLSSTCRGESNTNVAPLQKISLNDNGERKVVISANALRSAFRDEVLPNICNRVNATADTGISVNRSRVKNAESSLAVTYKGSNDGMIHDINKYIDDMLGFLEVEKKSGKEQRDGSIACSSMISFESFRNDRGFHQSPSPSHLKDKEQMLFSEECIYSAFRHRYQIDTYAFNAVLKGQTMLRMYLQAVYELGHVGGNRSRYYMEMRPENVIIRTSNLAASCIPKFKHENDWTSIVDAIHDGALNPKEIIIGGSMVKMIPEDAKQMVLDKGTVVYPNVFDALSHVSNKYCGVGLYDR